MLLQNIGQFMVNNAPAVATAFALNGSAALANGLMENQRQKSQTKQAGKQANTVSQKSAAPQSNEKTLQEVYGKKLYELDEDELQMFSEPDTRAELLGGRYEIRLTAMERLYMLGSNLGLALPTGKAPRVLKFLAKTKPQAVKAANGISVIGPRATYRQFARKIGANFLDVTDEAWTWAKNEKFLAGVVKRGDDVIFAGKFDPKRLEKGSVLEQEIKYFTRHGYQWTNDFTKMVKGK